MARTVLGGGLDVGEFFEDSQKKARRDEVNPYSITGDMFQSARKNRQGFSADNWWENPSGTRMAGKIFNADGSDVLFGNMLDNFKNEVDLGLTAYDAQVEMEANEIWDEYLKKAQKKKEGSGWSKALGTIGSIAGTVGSIASLFCDERVKTDIAPLQVSEVDDALSQMAFAVKAIREHA